MAAVSEVEERVQSSWLRDTLLTIQHLEVSAKIKARMVNAALRESKVPRAASDKCSTEGSEHGSAIEVVKIQQLALKLKRSLQGDWASSRQF